MVLQANAWERRATLVPSVISTTLTVVIGLGVMRNSMVLSLARPIHLSIPLQLLMRETVCKTMIRILPNRRHIRLMPACLLSRCIVGGGLRPA